MRLWSTNYPYNCDSGAEFYGTTGRMMLSKRGKLLIHDRQNKLVEEKREKRTPNLAATYNRNHLDDFREAIRTGRRPAADALEAHRTVALPHLANIALRTGRQINFDPEREQIVGDEEASRLLSRNYRLEGHWAVPKHATTS